MTKLTIHFRHSTVPSIWIGAVSASLDEHGALVLSTADRYAHYAVQTIDYIEVEELQE